MVAWPNRQAPRRWVGVRVGSRSIKIVQVEARGNDVRLTKHLVQELPVRAGGGVDQAGWLQTALKEFDTDEVHLCVSGPEVALRRVQIPPMPKHELREAIRWAVKEHVAFPVQEAVVDFQIVGEVWDKDIKKQDALVVVASRAVLQELTGFVERCGVRVASVVPTHFASWRCAARLLPDASRGTVALLEVSAAESRVTIVKDGHIRLVRELAFGSGNVTEALVSVVASERGEVVIDYSKAEALKRRYGVLTETASGVTDDGVPLFHLSSLMRPVLETLLTELSRVLSFYKVQMDESGINRILLCGGGANLKQLAPYLAEGLGIPTELFNPLRHLPGAIEALDQAQLEDDGPRLATALGAALEHGEALNLLPEQLGRRTGQAGVPVEMARRLFIGLGGLAAAGALVLALWLGMLRVQIRSHEQVWAKLAPAHEGTSRLVTETRQLQATTRQLERFIEQQPVWEGVFRELGAVTPPTIVIQSLDIGPPDAGISRTLAVSIKGQVASADRDGQGSIARFMTALQQSIFFTQVKLVSSEVQSQEGGQTMFELRGTLE